MGLRKSNHNYERCNQSSAYFLELGVSEAAYDIMMRTDSYDMRYFDWTELDRFGLRGQRMDDVAAGAVVKHSSQWNLTRESVLGCGLAAETPGLDLQRACGTSLEAAILVANTVDRHLDMLQAKPRIELVK